MSDQTSGQKIASRLWMAKAAAGKPMDESQVAGIIDGMIKELGLRKARPRVNGRDTLFDGLCIACGINPNEVTRPAGATIGTALADIAAVTPDLTPEAMSQRAARYKNLHPDWELTPSALATHWGELGSGDVGQTIASKHKVAPEGWECVFRAMLGGSEWSESSIDYILSKGWENLSLSHRMAIQKQMRVFEVPAVKPYAEVA